MTDPADLARILRSVRSVADTWTDIVHDPDTDVSEQRRATEAETEVLDLLHLPHPRAYVRLSIADWALVDGIVGALATARHHEEGTGA